MKRILLISLLFISFASSAQLTLSEKAALADNAVFRSRVMQALFSKANVYLPQTPTNLAWQKQVNYGKYFVKGGSTTVDAVGTAKFWLANYNGVPVLDANGQPTDAEILNSAGLDVVYNTYANVLPGDNLLPVQ